MKTLIMAVALLASNLSYAVMTNLGEKDPSECTCVTCLANGICKQTPANGPRKIKDSGNNQANIKSKVRPAGGVSQ